ncbi:MAG: hypothetical protein AB4426_23970 [Xenococcaceae cyanobacterium]
MTNRYKAKIKFLVNVPDYFPSRQDARTKILQTSDVSNQRASQLELFSYFCKAIEAAHISVF